MFTVAINSQGTSNYSLPLVAGVGAPSVLDGQLQHNNSYDNYDQMSHKMSLQISWSTLKVYSPLEIHSYVLYQDNGYGYDDSYVAIFDSDYNPMIESF